MNNQNQFNFYNGKVIDLFMSLDNQTYLTKYIYNLHRQNGGTLVYSYFKSVVPKQMSGWLKNIRFNQYMALQQINDLFCRGNGQLYEKNYSNGIEIQADTNVYRLGTNITGYDDEGNITSELKSFKNLMAEDYQSINVWKKVEVDAKPSHFRNNNKIPVYQSSMNTRHYDRTVNGFAESNPERASLNTNLSGYGSDFQKLISKHDALYKKDNTLL
jgi:hypothetical protein